MTQKRDKKPRRWRRFFLFLLVLAVLIWVAHGPILRSLGGMLVRQDAPRKADMIVVLSGSPVVRCLAAADYYRQGLAPMVYVSRGGLERADLVPELDLAGSGEWGLSVRILQLKGVPKSAIYVHQDFVDSTLDEAQRIKAYLARTSGRSIILVTSRFHSGRAYRTFSRQLGPDVKIISLPSKYDTFDPDNWWKSRYTAKRGVMELQKWFFNLLETSRMSR